MKTYLSEGEIYFIKINTIHYLMKYFSFILASSTKSPFNVIHIISRFSKFRSDIECYVIYVYISF